MKGILTLLLTTLLLSVFGFSYGQTKVPTCGCPQNEYGNVTKADTVFHLSNGKSIALCGYRDTKIEIGKIYFSEFVLAACGEKQVIKFWEAVLTCQVRAVKDTLIVETLVSLPTGKNMAFKWTVWTIEHIYFVNDEAVLDFKVNRQIPKYNRQQVELALKEYEHAKVGNTDANMKIADKLFISAISGSQKARTYLISLKERLGILSGEYGEWYNDDRRMLKLWDTNIPSEDDF